MLVEVEQTVLGELLGRPQSTIKKAIEKKKYLALKAEQESLFGTADRLGRLGYALGFDYGKDAVGRAITEPAQLKPSPPKTKP